MFFEVNKKRRDAFPLTTSWMKKGWVGGWLAGLLFGQKNAAIFHYGCTMRGRGKKSKYSEKTLEANPSNRCHRVSRDEIWTLSFSLQWWQASLNYHTTGLPMTLRLEPYNICCVVATWELAGICSFSILLSSYHTHTHLHTHAHHLYHRV